ncbi:MAG: hypothetical protein ACYC7A_04810 [Thermoanaerobaculia bacterium]
MERLLDDPVKFAAMLVVAVDLFGGDVDAWERFVVDFGTDRQRLSDLPWISEIRRLAAQEPAVRALLSGDGPAPN